MNLLLMARLVKLSAFSISHIVALPERGDFKDFEAQS